LTPADRSLCNSSTGVALVPFASVCRKIQLE
jgi:hypothetical protein